MTWDARAERSLTETGMINGAANNNFGDLSNRLVVPGDELHSIILNRTAGASGFTRMPPIGSSEIDEDGVALLRDWIVNTLPSRETYDEWRLQQFSSASSPEGAPLSDPDADGKPNREEFLTGTNPNDRADVALQPTITKTEDEITLSIALPIYRAFQVETSADLVNWSLWNVVGNDGVPGVYLGLTLSGPASEAQ